MLVTEVAVLSVFIPRHAARIVGGDFFVRLIRTQLFALGGFAISGVCAWAAFTLIGGETLFRLLLVGLLWSALAALPLFFLLFSAEKRHWIGDRLRDRFHS